MHSTLKILGWVTLVYFSSPFLVSERLEDAREYEI